MARHILLLAAALAGASAFNMVTPQRPSAAVQSRRPAANAVRMINLFGNSGEFASIRSAPLAGNPVVLADAHAHAALP